jgi:hypothetical protein
MTFFKQMDNFMMSVTNMNRYPKRLKTPFSQFLFAAGFQLSIAGLVLFFSLLDGRFDWFTCFMTAMFLLPIYYHWRRFNI